MDWIVTLPQGIEWIEYEREIAAVADGTQVMNYYVGRKPRASVGDWCYIAWRGRVRGCMRIVGIESRKEFICTTSGKVWKDGWYIQRSGKFHELIDGIEMKGFRGIRKYTGTYIGS